MKLILSKVVHLYNNQLITAILPTVFVYYTIFYVIRILNITFNCH